MTNRMIFGNTLALFLLFTLAACDSADTEDQPSAQADSANASSQEIENPAEPVTPAENDAVIMAYGRFVPEREDDFAWENDKVAFRVYGPNSSGKGQVSGVDAWLKKVPYSIIDKWYAGHQEGISYHEDHGEGYDPFHVGASRGVGGTAVWIDGVAWPAGKFDRYEVLESGENIVRFNLHYAWETPLGAVTESKTISLALGDQLYRVDSLFTLNGEPASIPVAIGLTSHDEKARVSGSAELGRISTSELIDSKGVWTGALMDPARTLDVLHIPSEEKDASHIWILTNTTENGALSFRAGFAWEAAQEITSFEQWTDYLDSRAGQ